MHLEAPPLPIPRNQLMLVLAEIKEIYQQKENIFIPPRGLYGFSLHSTFSLESIALFGLFMFQSSNDPICITKDRS